MNTFLNILQYVVLGFAILFTLGWSLRLRETARNEQAREKSMELAAFLMTASIVLVFVLKISFFHLLWMFPASFVLGLLSISTPLRLLWIFSSIYFSFWYIGTENIGRKYYLAEEYGKAIAAFENDINKNPKSTEAYFNLGLAYGKIGQHDKEISAYKEAVRLDPKRPELHFNLATAYDDAGDQQQAIEIMKEAIRLRPEYLKAHYRICTIYSSIGDNENTRKEFEIVKKLDSESAEKLESLITLL